MKSVCLLLFLILVSAPVLWLSLSHSWRLFWHGHSYVFSQCFRNPRVGAKREEGVLGPDFLLQIWALWRVCSGIKEVMKQGVAETRDGFACLPYASPGRKRLTETFLIWGQEALAPVRAPFGSERRSLVKLYLSSTLRLWPDVPCRIWQMSKRPWWQGWWVGETQETCSAKFWLLHVSSFSGLV